MTAESDRRARAVTPADPLTARSWRGSARRSSPRCRRSPWPPVRSTSARGSPTATARPRCSTPPSTRSGSGHNQYPPGPGLPSCAQAIARHQQRFYGLEHDPDGEVLVTAGATEALAGALLGMLDAGDEVSCSSRCTTATRRASPSPGAGRCPCCCGRTRRSLRVRRRRAARGGHAADAADPAQHARTTRPARCSTPTSWRWSPTWRSSTTSSSSPTRSTSTSCSPAPVHVPMATLPGMAERTLTISSGGKTFNTTGWKVGWMCGPRPLVTAARTAKQFLTYVNAGPFQPAIAVGLDLGDDFYAGLAADLTAKRDHLVAGLRAAGFVTYVPEATYFTTVDIRPVDAAGDGMAFCRALPGAVRRRRRPQRGVLRPSRARSPPRALRLLQAPRGPRRGGAAPRRRWRRTVRDLAIHDCPRFVRVV